VLRLLLRLLELSFQLLPLVQLLPSLVPPLTQQQLVILDQKLIVILLLSLISSEFSLHLFYYIQTAV
jgi:hypothetical protein